MAASVCSKASAKVYKISITSKCFQEKIAKNYNFAHSLTIKTYSRGRTHYNIYKDKGLKIKIIYKDFKNKNSFRLKEGRLIIGLPYSHKLYEYWQLCMHSLIALALHPPPSKQRDEAGWCSLLHSPTIFTASALLLPFYDMYNKRGVLNFTDNNPHEVCIFEIAM